MQTRETYRPDRPSGWYCTRASEERAEVLRQQRRLVEEDLALRDLPTVRVVGAAQPIEALADEEVHLALEPCAIQEKRGLRVVLVRIVGRVHAQVGNEMTGARGRILSPCHAGLQPEQTLLQMLFGLVEEGGLVGRRDLTVELASEAVGSCRHPVVDVVGHELEPLLEPPLVEQIGLVEEELLDVVVRLEV